MKKKNRNMVSIFYLKTKNEKLFTHTKRVTSFFRKRAGILKIYFDSVIILYYLVFGYELLYFNYNLITLLHNLQLPTKEYNQQFKILFRLRNKIASCNYDITKDTSYIVIIIHRIIALSLKSACIIYIYYIQIIINIVKSFF